MPRTLCIVAALAVATACAAAIDVRSFGAVGDGVADDTAALQRAADALCASERRRETHCVTNFCRSYIDNPFPALVFPKGVYRVSGPVVFVRNVMLVGEEGAVVTNVSACSETFYFREAHRLVVEHLSFAGGKTHIRQWTRNRDISYLHVSDCRFSGASGTSVVSDSFRDYRGIPEKHPNPSCEPVECIRGEDGLYVLTERDETKMTHYNNSTLIIVERCAFDANRTALRLYSDGVTVRNCAFVAPEGATAPQIRAGSGGCLGVEMYFRFLRFSYPGMVSAPRAAIQFDGGRLLVEKSSFSSGGALSAVRSYSHACEYCTASALDLRDVTLDCDEAPVVSIKGPWFPNKLSASSVKAVRGGRRKFWAFDEEPSAEFVKRLPIDGKHLRCIPVEHCVTFYHEGVDESRFDLSLPHALLPFVRTPPGTLRRGWNYRDGSSFAIDLPGGRVFRDDSMGRRRREASGDDTEKLAALVAKAKAAGGGVIELPANWLRIAHGFTLPSGTLVTCRGRVAIDMMDRDAPLFVVPEGADVAFKNVMFIGGRHAVVSASAKGRVRMLDCSFLGQKESSISAESSVPASFTVEITGGQAYTPFFYRGNALFVMDAMWYQMSCAADLAHTPRDHAAIVNLEGGVMRVREMLGVPVFFQLFGRPGIDKEEFVATYVGDYRWFDNSGTFLWFSNRTGGEYHGLTPVYHHGKAMTYMEGGVTEFSFRILKCGRWSLIAADAPTADITVIDVMSRAHRNPLLAVWNDKGEYKPVPSARYSNQYPYGY